MMLLVLLGVFLSVTASSGSDRGICDGKSARDAVMETPATQHWGRRPRNQNLPTPEIIRANGYIAEEHWVTTPDGYILALHRIPHGKHNKDLAGPRPVVFVQHGILCSSADWVIATPSKALGYILADAGYDVWLGNYRGNTYSRNHTSLDPDAWLNHKFWDFTWDEMGKYDIPAMVEKVLEITGQEELFYAGHSMGTTAFMAMSEYRPDIYDKVILANFMAPVTSEANMGGPLGWVAKMGWLIEDFINLLGIGEFLPSNWIVDCLTSLFCKEGATQALCSNILFILCGYDKYQLNTTLLPDILHHTPAGASTHTLLHYGQERVTEGFHAYDWGSKKLNMQHHQSKEPPVYNLTLVTTPVALYWCDHDYFAEPGDLLNTIMGLPNVVPGMNHEVEFKLFTHLDFLWGIDADKYVYSHILNNMQYCTDNDCRNLPE